ncbi:MAG: hypothetical protein M3P34_01185, partial [Actinomycetota bacterium]|nr:hypothetical protein [Actinomycetota bacterium]
VERRIAWAEITHFSTYAPVYQPVYGAGGVDPSTDGGQCGGGHLQLSGTGCTYVATWYYGHEVGVSYRDMASKKLPMSWSAVGEQPVYGDPSRASITLRVDHPRLDTFTSTSDLWFAFLLCRNPDTGEVRVNTTTTWHWGGQGPSYAVYRCHGWPGFTTFDRLLVGMRPENAGGDFWGQFTSAFFPAGHPGEPAPPAPPPSEDIDLDGLSNAEEADLGTNPYNPDSDYDGLPDGAEVHEFGTDPLHRNVDGDDFTDFEEIARGSDPYTADLTGADHLTALMAGFLYGDVAEYAVRWGVIDRATMHSLSFLTGWLLSGYAVVGDVRDLGSSLWRRDAGDALLSAVGVAPLVGDSAKTVAVVKKYVEMAGDMRIPVTVWITKQFAGHPALQRALLKVVGAGDQLDQLDDTTLLELAEAGNDLPVVEKAAQARKQWVDLNEIRFSGGPFTRRIVSDGEKAAIEARVMAQWPAARKAEAIGSKPQSKSSRAVVTKCSTSGGPALFPGPRQQ